MMKKSSFNSSSFNSSSSNSSSSNFSSSNFVSRKSEPSVSVRFISSLLVLCLMVPAFFASCQMGRNQAVAQVEQGDTIPMKYSQLLTLVKHGEDYTEAIIENPWKKGSDLHRYLLVPKGKQGDETVASLKQLHPKGDIVRTPLESSVVFMGAHCQLMNELGCGSAIRGVCDKPYINVKLPKNVVDCGSSMQPDIEKIIALHPEALLVSPFENSGGYGKLDKLHIPIIEAADYMETSPLGRAEWMKFYGMLFGENGAADKASSKIHAESAEDRADSLFARIEKEYLWLKAQAKTLPKGLSILTERKTGNVWYVPGGQSTIGVLLKDANAKYIFEDDKHSGSLPMSPEQILAKGKKVDVWAFKYFDSKPLTRPQLLQEYKGYEALLAFNTKDIYECNTSNQPYFELTSFHPEILLREFIILAHHDDFFGKLRFYKPMDAPDNLPLWGKTEECKE